MRHTTPGTRRTWSTAREWVAHLRDLLRRQGTTAKASTDLEAHLVAADRDWLRSRTTIELELLRRLFDEPKVRGCSAIVPPRGQRAGSPYELIVNETHNALARVHTARERHRRLTWARVPTRVAVQLSFDWEAAVAAAA
jgi:hypothetical protein